MSDSYLISSPSVSSSNEITSQKMTTDSKENGVECNSYSPRARAYKVFALIMKENFPMQTTSAKVTTTSPEKSEPANGMAKCTYCQNFIPEKYLEKHIKKKHEDEVKGGKDDFVNCHICNGRMHKVALEAHIQRFHNNNNPKSIHSKDQFTKCEFCIAVMHIDYIAMHVLRKHKSATNGAIDAILKQYRDEHITAWINERTALKDKTNIQN